MNADHDFILIHIEHLFFCKVYICKDCNFYKYVWDSGRIDFCFNNYIIEYCSCGEILLKNIL